MILIVELRYLKVYYGIFLHCCFFEGKVKFYFGYILQIVVIFTVRDAVDVAEDRSSQIISKSGARANNIFLMNVSHTQTVFDNSKFKLLNSFFHFLAFYLILRST